MPTLGSRGENRGTGQALELVDKEGLDALRVDSKEQERVENKNTNRD